MNLSMWVRDQVHKIAANSYLMSCDEHTFNTVVCTHEHSYAFKHTKVCFNELHQVQFWSTFLTCMPTYVSIYVYRMWIWFKLVSWQAAAHTALHGYNKHDPHICGYVHEYTQRQRNNVLLYTYTCVWSCAGLQDVNNMLNIWYTYCVCVYIYIYIYIYIHSCVSNYRLAATEYSSHKVMDTHTYTYAYVLAYIRK
jgi:hypothetical protein